MAEAILTSSESDGQGVFRRQVSAFRDWVTAGAGGEFPAVSGRYHLYVSLACPWACRTIIVRKLKGLEDAIPMTIVDPIRDARGWRFTPEEPDPVNGFPFLAQAYVQTDERFEGRVTVPVLYDTETRRIVNNESADIIRMLNSAFDAVAEHPEVDLYPTELRDEIDGLNSWIYDDVNNGVYQAGFATTQAAYEDAYGRVFAGLDRIEALLGERRYLTGDRITEADWRLFTTAIRFDAVYVGHFKCNRNRIADMPNLQGWLRELYQLPGIRETVDFDHIKRHYYVTHGSINPTGIVPLGPALDLDAPHGRG